MRGSCVVDDDVKWVTPEEQAKIGRKEKRVLLMKRLPFVIISAILTFLISYFVNNAFLTQVSWTPIKLAAVWIAVYVLYRIIERLLISIYLCIYASVFIYYFLKAIKKRKKKRS